METKIQSLVVYEIENSSVADQTKEIIKSKFLPVLEQLDGWEDKVNGLVVTDSSQKDLMKEAREARLILKNIRVGADKLRKELKEDSQAYLNTIQLVYNTIESKIKPMEAHLEVQEKFEEVQKEKMKKQLEHDRSLKLVGLESFVPFVVHSQLGLMSDDDFENVYQSAKLLKERKAEAEERANEEAEERAKEQAEERERQKAEMEKLMEEKRLMEAELKAEKERMEEKLRLEREENERIALELKRKQDEEIKAEKERIKAEKKLKNAPDKVKLDNFITEIEKISFPQMQSEDGELILKNVKELFSKIIIFAKEKVNNL